MFGALDCDTILLLGSTIFGIFISRHLYNCQLFICKIHTSTLPKYIFICHEYSTTQMVVRIHHQADFSHWLVTRMHSIANREGYRLPWCIIQPSVFFPSIPVELPWCHGMLTAVLLGVFVLRFHTGWPAMSGPINCSTTFNNRSLLQRFWNAFIKITNILSTANLSNMQIHRKYRRLFLHKTTEKHVSSNV